MKTRCIIVDDEPLAIRIITNYLEKFPNIQLVGTCNDAVEAFDYLVNQSVDLVFLDVEMPEMSGIDLIKSVERAPAIIFTTAYRDFAIDAFELNAIDYLLKPISFERFYKAISRYYQWKGGRLEVRSLPGSDNVEQAFIYVRADRKVQKIMLHDILFIESLKDYVKIHMQEKVILTKEQISVIEEKLPSELFLRIHRSFIVSVPKIEAFTSETIEVAGHELPVGRTHKNSVLSFLGYRE